MGRSLRRKRFQGISTGTFTTSKVAPVITSNGGGLTAEVNVAEGDTLVTVLTASGFPAGTWSIVGGADAALFGIVVNQLEFVSPRDYENPTDVGANNTYVVTVQVKNSSGTASQTITVNVTNVTEGSALTFNAPSPIQIPAGQTYPLAQHVSGGVPPYSGYGVDVGSLPTGISVDPITGIISVSSSVAPVTLTGLKFGVDDAAQALQAPSFTTNSGNAIQINIAENATSIIQVAATGYPTPTYSISGADAALFAINSTNGTLSFITGRDFENPADAGANNIYNVTVVATNSQGTDTLPVAVQITDVADTGTLAVGTLFHDGPVTPEQISLYLPITGTLDNTATATVTYSTGGGAAVAAHPLYRVNPAYVAGDISPQPTAAFVGVITGLTPGTTYTVNVNVTVGGTTDVKTLSSTTRALPVAAGAPTINISAGTSSAAMQTAINAAAPGAVIQIANGNYTLSDLLITCSGTLNSPIYLRGQSRDGTILTDTTGRILHLYNANHIIIENMTLVGSGVDSGTNSSSIGIRAHDDFPLSHVTLRNLTIKDVDCGTVFAHACTSLLVYDNTLEGNNEWTSYYVPQGGANKNITWNDDGITIAGKGNCAFNNTISGFGDSFAVVAYVDNCGVHFYRNRVLFSCDDAVELDYGNRNMTFYDNRVQNSMSLASCDPITSGGIFIFRNTSINTGRTILKFNDTEQGMFVYNNTFVRTPALTPETNFTGENALWYLSGGGGGVNHRAWGYRNNILIGRGTMPTSASYPGGKTLWLEPVGQNPIDFTNNAWFPDGAFLWNVGGDFQNLAAAKTGIATTSPVFSGATKRHNADVICESDPFVTDVVLGSTHYTQVTTIYDCVLANGSAPKNAGVAIPGVTDGFSGSAPDMGGVISGRPTPVVGDRSGGLNVQFSVTSSTGGNNLPFTFGHVFKEGDVDSTEYVNSNLTDWQAVPTSTWPDGSVRHAIISGRANCTLGIPTQIMLTTSSTPRAGTALTQADLTTALNGLAGSTNAAKCSLVCGTETITLHSLVSTSAMHREVCTGPIMSNWIYRKQLADSSHAVAWFDVRVYMGGVVEVFPWMENGYISVASPATYTRSYTFTLGNAVKFNQNDLAVYAFTRIPLISGGYEGYWSADPAITPKHTTQYLIDSRMFPNYGFRAPDAAALNGLQQTYTPNTLLGMPASMSETGGNAAILDQAQALYITSGDARAYKAGLVFGMSGGSRPCHRRAETGSAQDATAPREPVRFISYPNGYLDNLPSATPPTFSGTNVTWNVTHQPSYGYMPWLVTGRWWFLDEQLFWSGANYLLSPPQARQGWTSYATGPYMFTDGTAGVIDTKNGTYGIRGSAWGLRAMAQTLAILPTSHPLYSSYKAVLDSNAEWYNRNYVTGTFANGLWVSPLFNMGAYSGASDGSTPYPLPGNNWNIPTWQFGMLQHVWGFIKDLKLSPEAVANITSVCGHCMKMSVAFAGPGTAGTWNWRRYPTYDFPLAPNGHTYLDPATTYANYGIALSHHQSDHGIGSIPATPGLSLKQHSSNDDMGTNDSSVHTYFGQQFAALSYAVDNGVAGAQDGYNRITGSNGVAKPSNWDTMTTVFHNDPVYAIVPRT